MIGLTEQELIGIDHPGKLPTYVDSAGRTKVGFPPGYVPMGDLRPPFWSYKPDGSFPHEKFPPHFVPFELWYDMFVMDGNGEDLKLLPWLRPLMQYASTPTNDFYMPFQICIFSGPKKQTKTSTSSYFALWYADNICDQNGEVYVQANAIDHAKERAFGMMGDLININPILKQRFPESWKSFIKSARGVNIKPVANDPGTVAGCNNELVLGDEIWNLTTAAHKKVWAELTPTPSRRNSMRWVSTYAGYEGESEILEQLYKLGLTGEPVPEFAYMESPDGSPVVRVHKKAGMLFYWDHVGRMPYHQSKRGKQEIAKQRYSLPDHQFERLWRNNWAKSKGEIKRSLWERAIMPDYRPPSLQPNRGIYLAVGVDAGTRRDRAAVQSAFRKEITGPDGTKSMRICRGPGRRWDPKDFDGDIINLESTIEAFVKQLYGLFNVRVVVYDPWQMVRIAEEWRKAGITCDEYNFQSEAARVKLGTSMMDLLTGRELVTDDDPVLEEERKAVMLVQSNKGYQLSKQPGGRQDSFIAYALACHGARTLPPSGEDIVKQFMFLGGEAR
jgi:phage terminase large subunit-like protein